MTYNGSYVYEYELHPDKTLPTIIKRADFSNFINH